MAVLIFSTAYDHAPASRGKWFVRALAITLLLAISRPPRTVNLRRFHAAFVVGP
jgi:hypothetical protein